MDGLEEAVVPGQGEFFKHADLCPEEEQLPFLLCPRGGAVSPQLLSSLQLPVIGQEPRGAELWPVLVGRQDPWRLVQVPSAGILRRKAWHGRRVSMPLCTPGLRSTAAVCCLLPGMFFSSN